jgi:uncharacterized protein YqjF (DUF2071 family)
MPRRPFLTARWEDLVFLNYEVDPRLLAPLVPRGTELDPWHDRHLVSIVGFRFLAVRVLGLAIPWHTAFDEVNLRFYVRRRDPAGGWRRAVVFVSELVPRHAIAAVARIAYNEPYRAVPMHHAIAVDPAHGGTLRYGWRHRGADFAVDAEVAGPASPIDPASEAGFITEHYWGYTRQRDGGTLEYRVEHPSWSGWSAGIGTFTGPAAALHGTGFGEALARPPASVVVASGSAVRVHRGVRLVD